MVVMPVELAQQLLEASKALSGVSSSSVPYYDSVFAPSSANRLKQYESSQLYDIGQPLALRLPQPVQALPALASRSSASSPKRKMKKKKGGRPLHTVAFR